MTIWWGQFEIPQSSCARWRVGAATLWVQRLPGEWRVAVEAGNEDSLDTRVEAPCEPTDLLAFPDVRRFGVASESTSLELRPRLADRAVVARPERPFYVPRRQRVTIFVGTPLWVTIKPSGLETAIEELPLLRPSDTWFGPNSGDGELCYASRTACKFRIEEVAARPHRALTEVTIDNTSDDEFLLERLRLPVEHLGLYESADGVLWTQEVLLSRVASQELAPLAVTPGPPRTARGRPQVAPPRATANKNLLVRAFSNLFG